MASGKARNVSPVTKILVHDFIELNEYGSDYESRTRVGGSICAKRLIRLYTKRTFSQVVYNAQRAPETMDLTSYRSPLAQEEDLGIISQQDMLVGQIDDFRTLIKAGIEPNEAFAEFVLPEYWSLTRDEVFDKLFEKRRAVWATGYDRLGELRDDYVEIVPAMQACEYMGVEKRRCVRAEATYTHGNPIGCSNVYNNHTTRGAWLPRIALPKVFFGPAISGVEAFYHQQTAYTGRGGEAWTDHDDNVTAYDYGNDLGRAVLNINVSSITVEHKVSQLLETLEHPYHSPITQRWVSAITTEPELRSFCLQKSATKL